MVVAGRQPLRPRRCDAFDDHDGRPRPALALSRTAPHRDGPRGRARRRHLPCLRSPQMTENPTPSPIEAVVSSSQILKLVLSALGATAVIGLAFEALQTTAEYGRLVAD